MARLLTTTILMAMFLLAGCVEQPVEKVGADKQQHKQEAPKQVFQVGDIVKVGETEMTISSAKLQEPEQYVPANKGKVLVLIISGKNKGPRSWYLSDSDFNLYDASGNKLELYFSGQDTSIFGGEINQGKQFEGKIRFDVPEADRYELVYKPNFLTDQEIKFNIVPNK